MYRSDNDKQIGREDYRTCPLQRSKNEDMSKIPLKDGMNRDLFVELRFQKYL